MADDADATVALFFGMFILGVLLLTVGFVRAVDGRPRRRKASVTSHAAEDRRRLLRVGILLVAYAVGIGAAHAAWALGPNYTYDATVHGHVRNAYEVNTPEAMLRELEAVEAGMHSLGLEPGMYGGFFQYEKLPSTSMQFQYEYLAQLKERVRDVIAWRNDVRQGNQPETLADTYELKMDALRSFMREGCEGPTPCTDWIAQRAYFANLHPGWWWAPTAYAFAGLSLFLGAAVYALHPGVARADRSPTGDDGP